MAETGSSHKVGEWEVESTVGDYEERRMAAGQRALDDAFAQGDFMREAAQLGEGGQVFSESDEDRGEDAGNVEDTGGLSLQLRELAVGWQQASRGQVNAQLKRGYFPRVSVDRAGVVPERAFHCSRVINVTDLESAGGLYDALNKAPVVATLVGKTAIGKSTRLSAEIAKRCGLRVLQITPDTVLGVQHARVLAEVQRPTNVWSRERVPTLVLMTPQQFCGRFFGDGWDVMLSCFDVVLVDEAHIPNRWYYAIRAVMSTKAAGKMSLLMTSATASGAVDMQSTSQVPECLSMSIEDLAGADDFFSGPLAVDRSLILVESDERLRTVCELLNGNGVEVLALESGDSNAQVEAVCKILEHDSASLRILVAHSRFGTGYNLPVEKVITTGLRRVFRDTGDACGFASEPLGKAEVKQHVGRVGRGLRVLSHQGLVLLSQSSIATDVPLLESEKFGAYIVLVAMGIEPCKALQQAVAETLPHGITRRVAVAVLQVIGLPAEVVVRFLAADGAFPLAYARALSPYATRGGVSLISKYDKPLNFESWESEPAFAPLGVVSGPRVLLPMRARGELAVMLTFVCAAAERIFVPESHPEVYEEGYESGPDLVKAQTRRGPPVVKPRLPLLTIAAPEKYHEERFPVYSYDVPQSDQARYGRRMAIQVPGQVADHLAADGFCLGVPEVHRTLDSEGRQVVKFAFLDGSPVTFDSPGGSSSMTIPNSLWDVMSQGSPLNLMQFKLLLRSLDDGLVTFAHSTAFSHWNNCWLSILRTLATDEIANYIRSKALAPLCIAMCSTLWCRYTAGMTAAVQASHVTASWWHRMVGGFQSSRIHQRKASRGDASVAQTEDFKSQLYNIRFEFSRVLVAFERFGFYQPHQMADLQSVLPLSRRVGHSVVDAVSVGRAEPWRFGQRTSAAEQSYQQTERLRSRFDRVL